MLLQSCTLHDGLCENLNIQFTTVKIICQYSRVEGADNARSRASQESVTDQHASAFRFCLGRLIIAPTVFDGGAAGFGAPGGERVDRRLWRRKEDERVAAVEKIEDQRKPEDFFGYRNRIAPYGAGLGVGSQEGEAVFFAA